MSKRSFSQSRKSDSDGQGQYKPSGKKSKATKQSYYNKTRFMGGGKPELKFYDEINNLLPTNVVAGASGIISLINGMSQGVGAAQFQGNKITLKSIYLRISFALNPGATVSRLRYAVVIDNRPVGVVGTVPLFQDVFKLSYIAGTNYNSPLNLEDQRGRFQVLLDKTIDLSYAGGLLGVMEKQKYIKCNLPIDFNSGAAANIRDILFVSLSSEAVYPPSVAIQSRLRFLDN